MENSFEGMLLQSKFAVAVEFAATVTVSGLVVQLVPAGVGIETEVLPGRRFDTV
jgi:hypothetical protein